MARFVCCLYIVSSCVTFLLILWWFGGGAAFRTYISPLVLGFFKETDGDLMKISKFHAHCLILNIYMNVEFIYMELFDLFLLILSHLTFCYRSSRMVLLKGVDRDRFVWFVLISNCCGITYSWQCFPANDWFFLILLLLLYAGTPIMKVERHVNYLIIPMHHCFSIGMVLIDR